MAGGAATRCSRLAMTPIRSMPGRCAGCLLLLRSARVCDLEWIGLDGLGSGWRRGLSSSRRATATVHCSGRRAVRLRLALRRMRPAMCWELRLPVRSGRAGDRGDPHLCLPHARPPPCPDGRSLLPAGTMNGSDALLPGRAGRRRRAERLVLAVAVAGTVLIALGAFWLSFTSLSELARRCGIAPDRAWVWPLIVDGVIVVATVSVVAMSGGGWTGGPCATRGRCCWRRVHLGTGQRQSRGGCRRRARAVGAGGAGGGGPAGGAGRDHPSDGRADSPPGPRPSSEGEDRNTGRGASPRTAGESESGG